MVGVAVAVGIAIQQTRSGRKQRQQDRQDARADRSHKAAFTIATGINNLDQAIVTWLAKPEDAAALTGAYNENAQAIGAQSMELTDKDLQARVLTHLQLVSLLVGDARQYAAQSARQSGMTEENYLLRIQVQKLEELAGIENDHANAIRAAIEAHVNEQALPTYQRLPPDIRERLQRLPHPSDSPTY